MTIRQLAEGNRGTLRIGAAPLVGSSSEVSAPTRPADAVRPTVLATGVDARLPLSSDYEWLSVAAGDDIDQVLESRQVAALVIGPAAPDHRAYALIRAICERPRGRSDLRVILAGGHRPALEDSCLESGQLMYASSGPLDVVTLAALCAAAVERWTALAVPRPSAGAGGPSLMTYCERLARQTDDTAVFLLLRQEVDEQLAPNRVYIYRFDPQTHALVHVGDSGSPEIALSAAHGLVGFVAQTGTAVALARASGDARCDPEMDVPDGDVDGAFIAAPLSRACGQPLGVVAASRRSGGAPFSASEAALLAWLLEGAAAMLVLLRLRDQMVQDAVRLPDEVSGLYRAEALAYHHEGNKGAGSLLAAEPPWLRQAHWVAAAAIVVGLAFAALARVDEMATGPGVIRARHKVVLTASTPRNVRSVEFPVGSRVRTGDVLIRLHQVLGESAEDRVQADVRATIDGVISHVHVRDGRPVSPGDPLVSIVDDRGGYEMIALLPASYAPQLHRGLSIVLRLDGYQESRERAVIDEVSLDAIPAGDAARDAGLDTASAQGVGLAGPAVVVRASMPSSTYGARGRRLPYLDGMTARTQVSVRPEPLIFRLVPSARRLFSW